MSSASPEFRLKSQGNYWVLKQPVNRPIKPDARDNQAAWDDNDGSLKPAIADFLKRVENKKRPKMKNRSKSHK